MKLTKNQKYIAGGLAVAIVAYVYLRNRSDSIVREAAVPSEQRTKPPFVKPVRRVIGAPNDGSNYYCYKIAGGLKCTKAPQPYYYSTRPGLYSV